MEGTNVFRILRLKKILQGNRRREGKRCRIRKNEDKRANCKGWII